MIYYSNRSTISFPKCAWVCDCLYVTSSIEHVMEKININCNGIITVKQLVLMTPYLLK